MTTYHIDVKPLSVAELRHVHELDVLAREDVLKHGVVLSRARLLKRDGSMAQLELPRSAALVADPEIHLYREAHSAVWHEGGYEGGLVFYCAMSRDSLRSFYGCKLLVGQVSRHPRFPFYPRDAYLLDLLEGPVLGPRLTALEWMTRRGGHA